jgi:hypothetical protein
VPSVWRKRLIGSHGLDDIADGLAGCGGMSLVEIKRGVGGVGDDAMAAVGGEGGELFLCCLPGRVVAAAGGDDDQRLAVGVTKCGSLPRRGRSRTELSLR